MNSESLCWGKEPVTTEWTVIESDAASNRVAELVAEHLEKKNK